MVADSKHYINLQNQKTNFFMVVWSLVEQKLYTLLLNSFSKIMIEQLNFNKNNIFKF